MDSITDTTWGFGERFLSWATCEFRSQAGGARSENFAGIINIKRCKMAIWELARCHGLFDAFVTRMAQVGVHLDEFFSTNSRLAGENSVSMSEVGPRHVSKYIIALP